MKIKDLPKVDRPSLPHSELVWGEIPNPTVDTLEKNSQSPRRADG